MNKAQEKIIFIVGILLFILLLKNANMFYLASGTYWNKPGIKFGITKSEWGDIPDYEIVLHRHNRRCGSYDRIHTYKRAEHILSVTNPNGTTSVLEIHRNTYNVETEDECSGERDRNEPRDEIDYFWDRDIKSWWVHTLNLSLPTRAKADIVKPYKHVYIGPGKYTYKFMVYYYTRRYNEDYKRGGIVGGLTKTITKQYDYPAPTPSPTPTPNATISPSPTPNATVSPSPTASASPNATITPSPSPDNNTVGECYIGFKETTVCDDGREITTAICKDGKVVLTGNTCETAQQQPSNTMIYILVAILFLAIVGGVLYEEVLKK